MAYLTHRSKNREAGKMRRQKKTFQTREQDQTPEKDINKMERSNLPDKEFKVMVIKLLTKLRGR